MNGRAVWSAFPATGKTWLARQLETVVDSDSSSYSWARPGERHPEWPHNYLAHIRNKVDSGSTVLVSTHEEVRCALADAGLPFMLVYPGDGLCAEYAERMRERGSPESLIEIVVVNWQPWLRSCREQEGCEHHVLGRGEYLSDVMVAG